MVGQIDKPEDLLNKQSKSMNFKDQTDVTPIGGLRKPDGTLTSGARSERLFRVRNAIVASSLALEGKRVLDLGCAQGLTSLYLSATASEVIGVDHLPSMIEKAENTRKALELPNVKFLVGDVRDKEFLASLGKFDLIFMWGFLHRITDIFSAFQTLSGITSAFSLEWSTPVFPFMQKVSIASHLPSGSQLDPSNLVDFKSIVDENGNEVPRYEDGVHFWRPTPLALQKIVKNFGFDHYRFLGLGTGSHGESFESENTTVLKNILRVFKLQKPILFTTRRTHMIVERERDSITFKPGGLSAQNIPDWDIAIHDMNRKFGTQ